MLGVNSNETNQSQKSIVKALDYFSSSITSCKTTSLGC